MFKTIIIVIIITVVTLVALAAVDRFANDVTAPNTSLAYSEKDSDSLEVTISGEISHEGTYLLPLNSTFRDLIDGAGGMTSNADQKAFNLDLELKDGWDCYIAPLFDNGNTCSVDPIEKKCINTASAEELKKLSCFSSTVSNNIVSYRTENGSFQRLEEISNVSGIGPATWEKCKNYITLRE
ncbi:MAG TPA: hypothetical protein DDW18_01585 [Firmicutes bacterium]|nr:hypothetical protein [Bacillota bacterium]